MNNKFIGLGKRKSAIARVILTKGSGKISINKKDYQDYFSKIKSLYENILIPLELTDSLTKYDIKVNVYGSGISAQSDAISYGIAKSLLNEDPSNRSILKKNRLVTRDSRIVERKKYGKAGARKSFQFSKR